MKQLATYQTLVFDCDGVVLNSNKIKTKAFYIAALPYGEQAALQLVDYHLAHGGISRYKKFEVFLEEMVPKGVDGPSLNELLSAYAAKVKKGLMTCEIAGGLDELRQQTPDARWLVVSGGDQNELREVFAGRKLAKMFDGGIFGSPDNKEQILQREIENGVIVLPAVFLGDSRYDKISASRNGMDFIFVSQWTEFNGWYDYCAAHSIRQVDCIMELVQ